MSNKTSLIIGAFLCLLIGVILGGYGVKWYVKSGDLVAQISKPLIPHKSKLKASRPEIDPSLIAQESTDPESIPKTNSVVEIDGQTKEAKADPACVKKTLQSLPVASPHGQSVYDKIKDKHGFTVWLSDCSDMVSTVSTAAHEAVHGIFDMYESGGFYLLNKNVIKTGFDLDGSGMPNPSSLLAIYRYPRSQGWVESYLIPAQGAASSHESVQFLLNEFNAYTHDLHIQMEIMKYKPWAQTGAPSRVGMSSLMLFVSDYMHMLKTKHPQKWSVIKQNHGASIKLLWEQGEVTIQAAKGLAVADDEEFVVSGLCDSTRTSAISELIGRQANACVRSPTAVRLLGLM